MKIFLKTLNVIGAMLATVFMPVLLALCIATPVVSAVCSFTHPEDISAIIKSIDMKEIVLASPDLEKTLTDAGVSAEAVDKILDMEIVGEFTEMYLNDVTSILTGEQIESSITPDSILALYDKHSDEIVELIKSFAEEPITEPDSEIARQVRTLIENDVQGFVDSLPTAADIKTTIQDSGIDADMVASVFTFIQNSLVPLLIAVLVFLSLLIFGLRAYHLEGTIWLGINYTLAAVILFITVGGIDSLLALLNVGISEIAGTDMSFAGEILSGTLTRSLIPYAIAYAVTAVVMIAAFVLVRIHIAKKKKVLAAAAQPLAYGYQPPQPINVNPYSADDSQFTTAAPAVADVSQSEAQPETQTEETKE